MNEIITLLVAMFLSFLVGFLAARLKRRADGRLVIDIKKDEYFVALTSKPEELEKEKYIILKVYKKGD